MTAAAAGTTPRTDGHHRSDRPEIRDLLALGCAAGAAVLALTSTGSALVAALLLAIATQRRWAVLAVVLATASVGIRFGTLSLDDLAGLQSVLGPAGLVGPPAGGASAWCAAAALLLTVRTRPAPSRSVRGASRAPAPTDLLVLLATGGLAAAVVVGPGPDDLVVRVAATLGAVAVATAVGAVTRRTGRIEPVASTLAVLAGIAAVALAGWPTDQVSFLAEGDERDVLAIAATTAGLVVAAALARVDRTMRRRSSASSGAADGAPPRARHLDVAAIAAAWAGLVVAAQDLPDARGAGTLLVVGAVLALVAGHPLGRVAVVPGLAVTVVAFDSADEFVHAGAGAAVVALAVAAAAGAAGARAPGPLAGWRLVPALTFATIPLWSWSGVTPEGHLEATAVAVAVAGIVVVPALRRRPTGPRPPELEDVLGARRRPVPVGGPQKPRAAAAGSPAELEGVLGARRRPVPVRRPQEPRAAARPSLPTGPTRSAGRLTGRRQLAADTSHGSTIEDDERDGPEVEPVEEALDVDRHEAGRPAQSPVAAPPRPVPLRAPAHRVRGGGRLRGRPGRAP